MGKEGVKNLERNAKIFCIWNPWGIFKVSDSISYKNTKSSVKTLSHAYLMP